MRRRHAGDDADVGLGDLGEPPDLPRPVHAHLQDRRFLALSQPEERERQTHQVVLGAGGAEHASRPERLLEHRGQHLLGGGLPVAAGDRNDAGPVAPAMEGGEVPERGERVTHDDHAAAERGG